MTDRVNGAPVRLSIPARAENLTVVRQALTGVALAVGLEEEQIEDLKLAVTEACTNVVLHAYVGRRQGRMDVQAWVDSGAVLVLVRDDGRGITPEVERTGPGLGLGLKLIATLARDVRITAEPGRGTSVWMAFGDREPPRPPQS
ncbi:MAG: ATP-binding protein [Actinomycetota bacterium]